MQNQSSSKEIPADLLRRFARGDHQAFESIYWMYNAKVYNFVCSILHDPMLAEDIVQSLFLKLWEKRETINPELSFSSYLFTIAKNMVLKQTSDLFRSYESLEENHEALIGRFSALEPEIEARSLKEYVDSVVAQFPEVRRRVYLLSRKEQLSIREIAEKLTISERTVETHLYRSLKELKVRIEEQGVVLALFFLLSFVAKG